MITINERRATSSDCKRAYEQTEEKPLGVIGCYLMTLPFLIGGGALIAKNSHVAAWMLIAVGALGLYGSVWSTIREYKTRRLWKGDHTGFDVIRVEMHVTEVWKIPFTDEELLRKKIHRDSPDLHANRWLLNIAPGRYAYLDCMLIDRSPYTRNFVPRERLIAEWVRPPKGGWKPLLFEAQGEVVPADQELKEKNLPNGVYVLDGSNITGRSVDGERLVADLNAGFFEDVEIQDLREKDHPFGPTRQEYS